MLTKATRHIDQYAYHFVPVGAQALSIYRGSGEIVLNREVFIHHRLSKLTKDALEPNWPIPASAQADHKTIYGILGLISLSLCASYPRCSLHFPTRLSSAEYVIVLTGRERRGRLMGQEVYRATDFDILPLNPNISVQHPPHLVEGHLLALVRSHLNSSFLLFSYGWDVTTRLQAQWATQESTQRKALWEAACSLFSPIHSLLTIIAGG